MTSEAAKAIVLNPGGRSCGIAGRENHGLEALICPKASGPANSTPLEVGGMVRLTDGHRYFHESTLRQIGT